MGYLAPSILSADILQIADQIKTVEQNGADFIHIDVMDGHFVPNITFGPFMVKAMDRLTNLPLDVHLMITNPEQYIADFAKAGSNYITVHQEVCPHLDRIVQQIKENNCKAGISLNPATPISTIEHVLDQLDLVLIMSVNPGFGGQKFIPYTLDKIKALAQFRDQRNTSFLIEVDGGVNENTAPDLLRAGADILVAGNAVFAQPSISASCRNLKKIVTGTEKEHE